MTSMSFFDRLVLNDVNVLLDRLVLNDINVLFLIAIGFHFDIANIV